MADLIPSFVIWHAGSPDPALSKLRRMLTTKNVEKWCSAMLIWVSLDAFPYITRSSTSKLRKAFESLDSNLNIFFV